MNSSDPDRSDVIFEPLHFKALRLLFLSLSKLFLGLASLVSRGSR